MESSHSVSDSDSAWLQPRHSLKYYEQQVNDRHMTSKAPAIDPAYLPENSIVHKLAWKKYKNQDVKIYTDGREDASSVLEQLVGNGFTYLPIHPLAVHRFAASDLLYSGSIQFSASYRTVFFYPEPGGLLSEGTDGQKSLMLKLHIEDDLPGIAGDRRLTPERIEKCILLSDAISNEISGDRMARDLCIVPEFMGIAAEDSGVIFRSLPVSEVIPFFSLYSTDRQSLDSLPIIVSALYELYGGNATLMADSLGEDLAAPLIRPLLAGFGVGYSMEMHAQNTLFSPGKSRLIDRVYFRDLEGVIVLNEMRHLRGLPMLFRNHTNAELTADPGRADRWFNRNVDHDVGRIFRGTIDALLRSGVFDSRLCRRATQSIREAVREAIGEAKLANWSQPGRLMPYSRAPWGNGLRLGHYFRKEFR